MKTCSSCKLEKDDTEFYKKGKENRTNSLCKTCFNNYCVVRWIDRKKRVVKQFGGKCADCAHEYPYPVFEFHHLNPKEKDLSWNKLRLVSEERLQAELSKCVMLCANCHRIRHHEEYLSS